ncbi:ArsR/SmtB family transcription factor [Haloplanus sp. GCM10025708]|uniref:ArsR/SmtB family transcription factor n=1 Tax=Haloferacaceae TaxID=1644056 RepID=UPI00360D8029
MSSPLPHRPSIDHTPASLSVVDLRDDESTALLESLSCETARSILAALEAGPATASDLTDRVDTTLQNARYHLENLREAGVVADVGTWYSSKGREMNVYALTSERIELRIGTDDSRRTLAVRDAPPAEN